MVLLLIFTEGIWSKIGAPCSKRHPQKKSHQVVIQYQIFSPKNIQTYNIIWNENVISMNIYIYMHTIARKEVMNLKESGRYI